tara:strand:- start:869 stop:1561 length:693 start_codon:yes stop_codon:yes gene_type:complete
METGKTGKYFKYAIGEIILVVIGILIALQINNWNQDKQNKIYEKKMLSEVLDDLKLDSTMIETQLNRIKYFEKSIDTVIKASNDLSLLDANSIRLFGGVYFILNTKTLETIKSGNVQIPFDDELRKKITSHYHKSKFYIDLMSLEDEKYFDQWSFPIEKKYFKIVQDTSSETFDIDPVPIDIKLLHSSSEFNDFVLRRKSRVIRWKWAYENINNSTFETITAISDYLETN